MNVDRYYWDGTRRHLFHTLFRKAKNESFSNVLLRIKKNKKNELNNPKRKFCFLLVCKVRNLTRKKEKTS